MYVSVRLALALTESPSDAYDYDSACHSHFDPTCTRFPYCYCFCLARGSDSPLTHVTVAQPDQGHNAALRDTVSAFTNALLAATPAIPGLDASIVVPARRLHLTLGVMSLDPEEDPAGTGPKTSPRSLEAAKTLLREVRPRIMELLGEEALRVSLDCLDIMRPENGDRARAHVMWVGPAAGGASLKKLEEVAGESLLSISVCGFMCSSGGPDTDTC